MYKISVDVNLLNSEREAVRVEQQNCVSGAASTGQGLPSMFPCCILLSRFPWQGVTNVKPYRQAYLANILVQSTKPSTDSCGLIYTVSGSSKMFDALPHLYLSIIIYQSILGAAARLMGCRASMFPVPGIPFIF